MRAILDSESSWRLLLFPVVIGLLTTPSVALPLAGMLPEHVFAVWLCSAGLSILGYWMYIHAYGVGYRWIGSWMGGQGTTAELQRCLAWAQVPFIYIGLICLPVHFIFRDVLYPAMDIATILHPTPASLAALTRELSPTYTLINTLIALPCIYAYILSLKLMGEAHGFSAWKAFTTKLLAVALHIPIFGALFLIAIVMAFVLVMFTTVT